MHIILGFLGTIVTILILLNRLAEAGIDLGGLNPFLWNRRRKWRMQYQGDPVFKIESPMDATAILMVATVKSDGDMTREDKSQLLNAFEKEFNLSKKDAAGLLISSSHLLGDGVQVRENIKKFLSASIGHFTEEQKQSVISLITRITTTHHSNHPNSEKIIQDIKRELMPDTSAVNQTWA